jgi:methylation protein EvaC
MPLGNGFRSPADTSPEYFFELAVAQCERCAMVQLVTQPDPAQMFHDSYAFFSSTSARMGDHFREVAETIRTSYLDGDDPFVAEIGSNDGIMLQHFAKDGIRHLGIEPSANVAEVARGKGINTITEYFNADLANRIVAEHGQADAFFGANVMCHIPDLNSVAVGIKALLKPKGVLIFEDPYLGDIVEKTSYDQIYDEHAFYFSVTSVREWFARHDMEVIDAEHQEVHGGSMRYTVAHKGARKVSDAVGRQLRREQELGLREPATFVQFRKNVERSRDELMGVLNEIRESGQSVVGYAATSKSTTVINYCGITTDHVEYICDTTPLKHGKVSPGGHIPVRPYQEFKNNYPDFALLFAWNHSAEIMAKEERFRSSGGKWVTYVPSVQVIS